MRFVFIICSLFVFSCVRGQNPSYKEVVQDSCFNILDIDINKDGIKDKVAYNTQGDDLCFFVLDGNSYAGVYYGDNFNMDGLYFVIEICGFAEDDNVLYLKSAFNGAGGQTIEYFLSFKNDKWQLSKSFINSSSHRKVKICEIDYLTEDKNEKCIDFKFDDIGEDGVILELSNTLKERERINNFSKEFIFCFLNTYPLSASNVKDYNNLAFYLEQADMNIEAIYLLQGILQKFPNRTVAYVNLGDAYWKLDEIDLAKEAYQKYTKLMKTNGKENKIPQQVWERVR